MENKGVVFFNKKISDTIYHLRIKVQKSFFALPGQFINIRVSDDFIPLLRRPFSIFDCKKGFVDVVYKVVGDGTKKLSEKKKGDTLYFLGPAGNSYIDFLSETNISDKKIFLVAGGTGFVSIRFFAKWLFLKKINFKLFYGATNKNELLTSFFKNYNAKISTDDGSAGSKGLITDFLKKETDKDTIIFACGPQGMLKSIQNLNAFKKFASFEAYMGCAIGVCLSCVIKIKNNDDFNYVRVCKEGTVFDLDDVIF